MLGSKKKSDRKFAFLAVYAASFLYAFHYALPVYAESSFLEQFISSKHVGIVYSLASLLTIFILFSMPKIVRRFGNRRTTVFLIILEVASLLGLAALTSSLPIVILFVLHQLLLNLIFFNIDIFLESFSSDSTTGATRGIFLTLMNTAILIAPFVAGFIMTNGDFWKLYIVSAVFMAPAIFFIGASLQKYKDPHYRAIPLIGSLKRVYDNINIRKVFIAYFLLYFFYVWMIIYTPIYLHKDLGIPFNQILGVIMPIVLLPFILFQLPLGKLADTKYGEKEIMAIGFVIAGLSTGALAFITSSNIFVWAGALFMTRVGASFIEIMSETYFYKQIGGEDVDLISSFRNLRPLSYIIAPVIATILISFALPQQYLFLVLGLLMLTGIPIAWSLKDTR